MVQKLRRSKAAYCHPKNIRGRLSRLTTDRPSVQYPQCNAAVKSPTSGRTPGNGSSAKWRVISFRIEVLSYSE
jgi:hypothetical protein